MKSTLALMLELSELMIRPDFVNRLFVRRSSVGIRWGVNFPCARLGVALSVGLVI